MKNLTASQRARIINRAVLVLLCSTLGADLRPEAVYAGPYDTGFNTPKLQAQDFLNLGTPRVVLQPDGKILIHGSGFNTVGGIETGPLARFLPDGTRDSSFAFSPDYAMTFSVSPLANGQTIVNATLGSFSGERETLLRVNPDGTLDNSFNTGTGANGNIRAITVQPDGKLLVGGLFTTFNGSQYPYLVRLSTNGNIDSTFAPISLATNPNSSFNTGIWSPILVQPDGKIIVGGVFTAVNAESRDGLVRLNPDGTVDLTFAPAGFSELNGRPVRGLGFQSNGMLVVGGRFSLGANSTRRPLVRVNTNGVADPAFVTSFTSPGSLIRDLKVLPDDRILAVDDKVYRFNADGTADAGFAPDFLTDKNGDNYAGMVFTVSVQSDGKIVFAGMFSFVGSQRRDGVARLNSDGSLDSFDVGRVELDRFPKKVGVQKDGNILIASDFEQANGSSRPGLARFNRDGTLDPTFDPATSLGTNTSVMGAALQPDDKIFIATVSGSFGPTNFARLNPDGTLDTNFNAVGSTEFGDAFALSDGRILLLAANNPDLLANRDNLILRLNPDGTGDNNFQLPPDFDQAITDPNTSQIIALYAPGPKPLLQLPDDKLLVASFTTNFQFKLARLNSDGSLDNDFQVGVVPGGMQFSSLLYPFFDQVSGLVYFAPIISAENAAFFDAAAQPDGQLIVVGQFTNYNGSAHNGIVRLNSDGTLDPGFNPGGPQWVSVVQTSTNLFPRIESVRVLSNNKILLAGNFEAFSGFPFNGLVRLNSDGSVDTNFVANLTRRNFGLFPRSPSSLIEQPDGNYLLTGQFSQVGSSGLLTLSRLLLQPALSISRAGSGAALQLNLTGGADRSYLIQASSNLVDWIGFTNLVITNDVNSFLLPKNFPRQFYRASSLP